MTRRMSQHNPRRLRTRPVQVYLSEAEREALDWLASRQHCSRSDLVRAWIHSARLGHGKTQAHSAARDTRQLEIDAPPAAARKRPGTARDR